MEDSAKDEDPSSGTVGTRLGEFGWSVFKPEHYPDKSGTYLTEAEIKALSAAARKKYKAKDKLR